MRANRHDAAAAAAAAHPVVASPAASASHPTALIGTSRSLPSGRAFCQRACRWCVSTAPLVPIWTVPHAVSIHSVITTPTWSTPAVRLCTSRDFCRIQACQRTPLLHICVQPKKLRRPKTTVPPCVRQWETTCKVTSVFEALGSRNTWRTIAGPLTNSTSATAQANRLDAEAHKFLSDIQTSQNMQGPTAMFDAPPTCSSWESW